MAARDLTSVARLAMRAGAYASNLGITRAEKSARGRKAFHTLIARKCDPDGRLEASDPAEFARQFEIAKHAHMLSLRAKSMQRAEEDRLAAAAEASKWFIITACPECNRQAGRLAYVPETVNKQLCIPHWIAAHQSKFDAMLDEAEQRIAG